ncbi:tRNA lysidine(34) synthetase TilS, partial [bacterium]|nr:tRNA lysidine(34) synthetase TilS [bacterium]
IKKKFESLKPGLQQRAVHRFLVKAGVEYDRKRVLDVLSYISKRKKYSLTTNLYLVSDDEYIYATQNKEKNTEDTAINENGRYKTFNGGELELLPAEEGMKFPKETDLSALVDLSRVSKELVLRTRRDGDVITPFGMNGKMKLKKYLISKKVPVQKRDELPILAQGNEALWVVGVGISEKLRVAKLPTNVVKYKY